MKKLEIIKDITQTLEKGKSIEYSLSTSEEVYTQIRCVARKIRVLFEIDKDNAAVDKLKNISEDIVYLYQEVSGIDYEARYHAWAAEDHTAGAGDSLPDKGEGDTLMDEIKEGLEKCATLANEIRAGYEKN